jgi:hypothetical protein
MTKLISFYLPQFHEIPENNQWWGEGFTDWVNVKKGIPLIKGQNQPRIPLNNNYYDLSDISVLKWQSDLAQEYGIDAFCYYHYWFNGKLLLEKPLEMMLKNKNISIPFCFCWANEPWARTWDGLDNDVLMPQNYGDENEWINHFQYLINFFKDDRYIKVDNKPIFIIYKTLHIPNVDKMCSLWDSLARKNGYDGIYFIEMLGGIQKEPYLKISESILEFEPNYTISGANWSKSFRIFQKVRKQINKGLSIFDYDFIWSQILKRDKNRFNKNVYLGAFVDWDNTPRKGNRGVVFKGSNPEKFKKYLKKQIERSKENDFIFINAWNEWAEGTYLEPDVKSNLGYLKVIQDLKKK